MQTTAEGSWDPGDPQPWELESFPERGSNLQLKNSTRREQAPPLPAQGWMCVSGSNKPDNQRGLKNEVTWPPQRGSVP